MGRTKVELKKAIVDGLEQFPMTTHGVSQYITCHYTTAEDRLEELREDGVVVHDGDKWRLNR